MPINAKIPNGFNKNASDILPCSKCRIDLVVPHEGQGKPTVLFSTHICRPGLDSLKQKKFQPIQLSPKNKKETIKK